MDDPVSYVSLHIPLVSGYGFDWQVVAWFGGVVLLLVCSALISGSEVAYFALSRKDIDTITNVSLRKRVERLLSHPKRLLATILISNNAVNLAIVILSGFITGFFFTNSDLPAWLIFLVQVVFVTFLILLFGEVLPKVYATKYPGGFLRVMSRPLYILSVALRWLSDPLVISTSLIDRRIRKKNTSISADDLSAVIDFTSDTSITEEEKKIWKGIVEFGTIEVKETMTPRTDVMALEMDTPYKEVLAFILDSGYSRIPVYKSSFDKVVGILYIKDLLPYLDKEDFNWQSLLRPVYYVPEKKMIDDLLKEFQAKKIHLAVVVDEYGGTSGIITLEDVIEEIVGEINDEFDDEQIVYSRLDDENFVFEGKTSLVNMCRILDIDYSTIEEYAGDAESIAGLILQLNGSLPEKNQVIDCNHLRFTIESVDKKRIKRIKVTLLQPDPTGNTSYE